MSHWYYITPEEYEQAEAIGVDSQNLDRRVRLLGWKKDKAINTPLESFTDRSYWSRVAEENGIKYQTFYSRIVRGWSEEKAATTPLVSKQEQLANANRGIKRIIPSHIIRLAEENNIKYHTLRERIRKGMDPHEAATRKLMTKSEIGKLGAKRYEEIHGRFHKLIFKPKEEVI